MPGLLARLEAVVLSCIQTAEISFDVIEQVQALIAGRFVTDVIDGPSEVVDRHQVPAVPPRQQPQGDREVLGGRLRGQRWLSDDAGGTRSDRRLGRHAAREIRRGRCLSAGPIASHDLYLRMRRQFDANNDAAVT
jgi:hypothetical protein